MEISLESGLFDHHAAEGFSKTSDLSGFDGENAGQRLIDGRYLRSEFEYLRIRLGVVRRVSLEVREQFGLAKKNLGIRGRALYG